MLCVSFYLCLTLNKRSSLERDRSKLLSNKKVKNNNNNKSGPSKSINANKANKQTSYANSNSENLSWSTLTGLNTSDELNKIREDNSYLAQQNQQLMLANLLASSNKNPLATTNPANLNTLVETNNPNNSRQYHSNNNNNIDPTHHQQTATANVTTANSNTNRPTGNLILGRSVDPSFGGTQRIRSSHQNSSSDNNNNNNFSCIKRRRSIGSSAAPILMQEQQWASNGRYRGSLAPQQSVDDHRYCFDNINRAKSRSQTTIHYDQNQDPFKTIPFNYLNAGYLSDGTTSRRVYLTNNNDFIQQQTSSDDDQIMLDRQDYLIYQRNEQQKQHPDESMSHSLPPENMHLQYQNNNQRQQFQDSHSKRWYNFNGPSNQIMQNDINNNMTQSRQKLVSSQFDPQQNSHQLIDLIQQKHRQQIEQANRTAASISHPETSEQVFNQQVSDHSIHHRHNHRPWK